LKEYSALKRNEILTHATTWMILENTVETEQIFCFYYMRQKTEWWLPGAGGKLVVIN
jgi:hypothetical protein